MIVTGLRNCVSADEQTDEEEEHNGYGEFEGVFHGWGRAVGYKGWLASVRRMMRCWAASASARQS